MTELFAKRATAWEAAKRFLDTHTMENGTMSAEDAQTYERMEADIQAITAQIERRQRLEEMENNLKQPVDAPIVEKPMNGEMKSGRASDAYKKNFNAYLRNGQRFSNDLSPMVEGTAASGGYLVPTDFENQIISGRDELNVVRPVSKVIRTNSDHKIPVVTAHGAATWTAEGGAFVESKPTLGQLTLSAYKLGHLVTVSTELLQDSMFNIDAFLASEFARAFAVAEETAFCVGTGSTNNQPEGIFTAAGGTVGVTAAKTGEITADEIISLVYALKAPYRQNAKFLMKDSTVAAVRKLKDGNGVYMWQPALANGQPDKLLGYDLLTTAYAPAIAAGARVAAFGDFQNYWIADRMGMTIQRLNERYADYGLVGFIASERVDAKVVLAEGIQVLQMKAS